MSASRPLIANFSTHLRISVTLKRAMSVMPTPANFTARAVAFKRVPSQVGHATSTKSSTSGSAKVCSRPLSLSSRTESSNTLRWSLLSFTPVPTQSGHQPCLLLYENKRGSNSVYEVAHTGHARRVENTSKRPMLLVSVPASIASRKPSSWLSTCTTPLPCSSAVVKA